MCMNALGKTPYLDFPFPFRRDRPSRPEIPDGIEKTTRSYIGAVFVTYKRRSGYRERFSSFTHMTRLKRGEQTDNYRNTGVTERAVRDFGPAPFV